MLRIISKYLTTIIKEIFFSIFQCLTKVYEDYHTYYVLE